MRNVSKPLSQAKNHKGGAWMRKKYRLGDYVEYYTMSCKNGDKIEYFYPQKGFVNGIEDRMQEDGTAVVRYTIGQYIGGYGHVVCEDAIKGRVKAPENKSRLEYLKVQARRNKLQIDSLNCERRLLQKEIENLGEKMEC